MECSTVDTVKSVSDLRRFVDCAVDDADDVAKDCVSNVTMELSCLLDSIEVGLLLLCICDRSM